MQSSSARRRFPCRAARSGAGRRNSAMSVWRALETRLQDDADVLVPGIAEPAVERERVVDARRVLHVDPDEGAARRSVAHDALEQRPAELEVELQPEPGELDGDVRVEPARRRSRRARHRRPLRSPAPPRRCGSPRRARRSWRAYPAAFERDDRAARVVERRAGDVRRRDTSDDGAWDDGQRSGYGTVEEAHGDAIVALGPKAARGPAPSRAAAEDGAALSSRA